MTGFVIAILATIAAIALLAVAQRGMLAKPRPLHRPRYVMLDREPPHGVRGSVRSLVDVSPR